MKRLPTILWLAAAAAGGGALVLFLRHVDLSALGAMPPRFWLEHVGGVLLFQVLIIALHSLQWGLLLREAGIRPGPFRILAARFSGSAVSYLSPSLSVGGEIVRAALVRGYSSDDRRLAATVAVDKYVELTTRLPLVLAGLAMLLGRIGSGSGLMVGAAAAFAALILSGTFYLVLAITKRSAATRLAAHMVRPLASVRPALARRLRRSLSGFVSALSSFRPRLLAPVLFVGVLSAGVELLQISYLLRALGLSTPGGPLLVLAVSVLGGIVGILPANVGGMEAANLMVFSIIGASAAAGIAYSMVTRGGQLGVITIGAICLLYRKIASAKGLRLKRGRHKVGVVAIDGNERLVPRPRLDTPR